THGQEGVQVSLPQVLLGQREQDARVRDGRVDALLRDESTSGGSRVTSSRNAFFSASVTAFSGCAPPTARATRRMVAGIVFSPNGVTRQKRAGVSSSPYGLPSKPSALRVGLLILTTAPRCRVWSSLPRFLHRPVPVRQCQQWIAASTVVSDCHSS